MRYRGSDSDNEPLKTHQPTLRACLDYNEDVHRSRILGERRNMIGYEMGSSLAEVYSTTKASPVKNLKHGQPTWQHFWLEEFVGGQVFWANSQPFGQRNLTAGELQLNVIIIQKKSMGGEMSFSPLVRQPEGISKASSNEV